jgi:uncharacterized protein YecE (DUF72 family)
MPTIKVGTSGWSYDHWDGTFYPEGVSAGERLTYYATRLPAVEIDGTFYRLPSEDTVAHWRDEVPPGFAFAAKGSRFVTHFRRLEGARDQARGFVERLSGLGEKLAVVLWQLPPGLSLDAALLDRFLGALPPDVRYAVEFRDASWLVEPVFDVLRRHGCAHVHVSSDAMPEDRTVTADFVYVRFHGTASYHGAYQEPALRPWCEFLERQVAEGRDGYAFFNNDAEGHAPRDAERLTGMLGEAAYRLPEVPAAASTVAAPRAG